MRALLLFLPFIASAAVLHQPTIGIEIDEAGCRVHKPVATLQPSARQVFFAAFVREIHAGDRLRLEWITPQETIAESAPYDALPAAPALCLITHLPVAGFEAASNPGKWAVRVIMNDREIGRYPFEIQADLSLERIRIQSLDLRPAENTSELTLNGAGFDTNTVVHIAVYDRLGGWKYIHSLLPRRATANRIEVPLPALAAGEYLAIVRGSDGTVSHPSRFVVSTNAGYRLPFVSGETWRVSQTPYGGFSHWGNTLHAYDLAPVNGSIVAAMRGGLVYAHDLGLGQTPRQRIFGNYITIDHGDGEFSHYGHLKTGSFLVRTGDRVTVGQALARAGTSGYSFGVHLHVQVTRSPGISSGSVPFQFAELAGTEARRLQGRELSSSLNQPQNARFTVPEGRAKESGGKGIEGAVAVGGRWMDLVQVRTGSLQLRAGIFWEGDGRKLALKLVSPTGTVYEAPDGHFQKERPEVGSWRLVVDGMQGTGEMIRFRVDLDVSEPPARQLPVRARMKKPRA